MSFSRHVNGCCSQPPRAPAWDTGLGTALRSGDTAGPRLTCEYLSMELFARGPRQTAMTLNRIARSHPKGAKAATATVATAAIAVGLATLAGCGTTAASGAASGSANTTSSTPSTSASTDSSGTANTESSTTATGCASVTDTTKVTALRAMHLVEPGRAAALQVTDTDPATAQALFRDFCEVISHKDNATGMISCPNDIGLSYSGTFYDGNRPLADYTYAASGCAVVSLTASTQGAKPESAMVFGTAASAAPGLHADMAKALGLSQTQVFEPYSSQVNPGGPDKK
jgi:hypothetical protein